MSNISMETCMHVSTGGKKFPEMAERKKESKQSNDDATWHHQIDAINELSVHGISLCEHKPENGSFSPWLYETNQITAMKAHQNTWIQLGTRLYYGLQKGKHNRRPVTGYELHTLAKELDIPTNHPNLCVLLSARSHKGNTMSCFALTVDRALQIVKFCVAQYECSSWEYWAEWCQAAEANIDICCQHVFNWE